MKKFKNKFLSIGISLGFILSCSNTTFANSNFSDVSSNHWAIKEINEFQSKGILQGYEDGTFKPNNNITRAEFMKIITQTFEIDTLNSVVPTQFSDIKGHWAESYIRKGVSNGAYDYVLDGTLNSSFRFRPNDYITREEAFTILATYLGINDREDIDRLPYFYDGDQVVYWAKRSVEGLIEYGFLKGYEDRTINPKGKLTRAEVIKMIDRVEEIGKATNYLYDNYTYEENRTDITFIYEDVDLKDNLYGNYIKENFHIFTAAAAYNTEYETWGDTYTLVRKSDHKVLFYTPDVCVIDPETGKTYNIEQPSNNYLSEEESVDKVFRYIKNNIPEITSTIGISDVKQDVVLEGKVGYLVHAVESLSTHTSTIGYYFVDKKTGYIYETIIGDEPITLVSK